MEPPAAPLKYIHALIMVMDTSQAYYRICRFCQIEFHETLYYFCSKEENMYVPCVIIMTSNDKNQLLIEMSRLTNKKICDTDRNICSPTNTYVWTNPSLYTHNDWTAHNYASTSYDYCGSTASNSMMAYTACTCDPSTLCTCGGASTSNSLDPTTSNSMVTSTLYNCGASTSNSMVTSTLYNCGASTSNSMVTSTLYNCGASTSNSMVTSTSYDYNASNSFKSMANTACTCDPSTLCSCGANSYNCLDAGTSTITEQQSRNETTTFGPNETIISKRSMSETDWTDYRSATNHLIDALITEQTLASHYLRFSQLPMDNKIVEDIFFIVCSKCNVNKLSVQSIFTKRCLDAHFTYLKHSNFLLKVSFEVIKSEILQCISKCDKINLTTFGPNATSIPVKCFNRIRWYDYKYATVGFMYAVFGENILSTHTVEGRNMLKQKLDPKKVEDIICVVCNYCNARDIQVKIEITNRCASEQRRKKARINRLKKRK